MSLHLVLFISTSAQLIVRYKINFPLEGGTVFLTVKQKIRENGESSKRLSAFLYTPYH